MLRIVVCDTACTLFFKWFSCVIYRSTLFQKKILLVLVYNIFTLLRRIVMIFGFVGFYIYMSRSHSDYCYETRAEAFQQSKKHFSFFFIDCCFSIGYTNNTPTQYITRFTVFGKYFFRIIWKRFLANLRLVWHICFTFVAYRLVYVYELHVFVAHVTNCWWSIWRVLWSV